MLQRQIMFKQLEELQRQKKLQELNDPRQHNVINQQSLLHNKQANGAQYAPLINGTPVRDPSQMFMFGNNNLVQGFQNRLPYLQSQNQVLHSSGLAPQLIDGTPIPTPGHGYSHFPRFQGATRESSGEIIDTISRPSMNDQLNVSYQERNMFGPVSSQGSDQQEFGRGQEQGIDQDVSGLDPMEQKFLFDTDDTSLGGFANMFEDETDNSQALPSLQSGSWSALMQSALEETSSTDTGVQEEWSGLSFQNPEPSNDIFQQNNSFQNASSLSSRPEHLKTANASLSIPGSLQSHQALSGPTGEYGIVPNNDMEFKKGLLAEHQSQSKASEATAIKSSDSTSMSAIVDRSADVSALDSNAQTSRHMVELLNKVDKFREYRHGTPSAGYTDSAPTSEMPKVETADTFTPPTNSSAPQYFGLKVGAQTQRPPMSYFDLSQISQQAIANSARQGNVWVDIPSQQQQNLSGVGIYKAPSGSPSISDVANSRMETASEAPKEANSQMYRSNDLLEASGHVLNSQGFEEQSFSGRSEANMSLKQAHISSHGYSPLNPATLKNEMVDSETKVPQLTSMSHLTSTYDQYKTMLMSSAKNSCYPPLQDVSQPHRNNSFVQMNIANTSQYGSWPVSGTNSNQLTSPYLQHLNMPSLVSQSKKRKFPEYELLPWHKEATKGSSRLHDMSIAELEWAHAAKRIPQKLKEEAEALGDSPSMVHSKKRIILTTQLMQVLFRPAPAGILSDDAAACYNTVTYFAARLALGDACSLVNRSHTPSDISDSSSGKNDTSKGSSDQNLSKIVEDLIARAKKLEDELLRLENGGSVLEIRLESQDLEKFSVINRFAKFHSRAQMAAAETGSSGGASTVTKLYPQRYVTASQMPKIVPEGHNCLSL